MQNTNTFRADNIPMSYIHEFHKLMTDNDIILIYEGDFSQEITKTVLAITERKLENEGVESTTKKKVYSVMVESLQNISKHQFHDVSGHETGSVFMIGYTDTEYLIISANPILNEKVELVRGKIDHVNSLDKEGLKQLYKDVRMNGTISEVGGAGLGFIDMARKSGNKIEYLFDKTSDNISYFSMMARVSKKDSE
jgi:hypothetical protein